MLLTEPETFSTNLYLECTGRLREELFGKWSHVVLADGYHVAEVKKIADKACPGLLHSHGTVPLEED